MCKFVGVSSVDPTDVVVPAIVVSSSQLTCKAPPANGIVKGTCPAEINARKTRVAVALNGETFLPGPIDFGYFSIMSISPSNGPNEWRHNC